MICNEIDFQVAFIHIDRQMILTVHNHVITRNPRISISHDNHLTWTLKIEKVTEEDKGFYMCQLNTDPIVSTIGHLDVVGKFCRLIISTSGGIKNLEILKRIQQIQEFIRLTFLYHKKMVNVKPIAIVIIILTLNPMSVSLVTRI